MLSLHMVAVTLRASTCEACCSGTTAKLVAMFVALAYQYSVIRFCEPFAGFEWFAVSVAATAACSPAAFLLPLFLVSMVLG